MRTVPQCTRAATFLRQAHWHWCIYYRLHASEDCSLFHSGSWSFTFLTINCLQVKCLSQTSDLDYHVSFAADCRLQAHTDFMMHGLLAIFSVIFKVLLSKSHKNQIKGLFCDTLFHTTFYFTDIQKKEFFFLFVLCSVPQVSHAELCILNVGMYSSSDPS